MARSSGKIVFLLSRMSPGIRRCAGAVAVREVGPRDLVETFAAARAVHITFMEDCVVSALHVVRELSNEDAVAAWRRSS